MLLHYSLTDHIPMRIIIPQQFRQSQTKIFPTDLKLNETDYVFFCFLSSKGFGFIYLGKLLCISNFIGSYGQANSKQLTFEYGILFLRSETYETTSFIANATSPYPDKSLFEVLKMVPSIQFPEVNKCQSSDSIESLNDIFKPKPPTPIEARYLATGKVYTYNGENMGKLISIRDGPSFRTKALQFEGAANELVVKDDEEFYVTPKEEITSVVTLPPVVTPVSSSSTTLLPSLTKSSSLKLPPIGKRGGKFRTNKRRRNYKKSKYTRKYKVNKKYSTRKYRNKYKLK